MINKKILIWYIFLILQPIIDICTSLMTRYFDSSLTLGVIVRGLFLLLLIIYILFFNKSKYKKESKIYVILLIVFTIVYFLTKIDYLSVPDLKREVIYIFKYYYFPISFIGLLSFYEENNVNEKITQIILKFILITVTFSILIACITNSSFVSYQYGMQGTAGWFYAANEISATTAILYPFIFLFLTNKENIFNTIMLIPISLSICLIGTKTSFLGLIIILLFYFIYYLVIGLKLKKFFFKFVVITLVIFSVIQASPKMAVVQNFKSLINNFIVQKQIMEEKNNKDNVTNNSKGSNDKNSNEKDSNEKDSNITKENISNAINSIVLSGRKDFLKHTYSIFEETPFVNKLFGISFSNIEGHNVEKLIEMDIFDIFFRYGVIGTFIYILPFIIIMFKILKLFVLKIKNHKKLNITEFSYLYSIIIGIGVSSFAGHVLGAPAVSIYLTIIIIILYRSLQNSDKTIQKGKITILALHLGYGGVEKYISSVANMLNEHFEIEIISTYKIEKKPAFFINKNVKILYLMNDSPHKKQLKEAILKKQIFIILKEIFINIRIFILKYIKNIISISQINSEYIFTTREFHSYLVGKYSNNNIIKIASEHNFNIENEKYINKILTSIEQFDYFILVSNDLKKFYEKRCKSIKCIYIPNSIEYIPKKIERQINNELISIGRLEKEKGFDDLLDVINIIKKDIPKIKLHLIGDGSELKSLKLKAKKLLLDENIIFHGYLNTESMEKYLRKSSLYIMTSHTESFGIVLLEAMSYSLPCIAFDTANGPKNLLKDNVGILIKNRDKELMAKRIIELLENKNQYNILSIKSYESCYNYSNENIKKQLFKIFK